MKTYLSVWFHSDGKRPSEVNEKLKEFGFEPTKGSYDYVYKWKNETTIEEVMDIGNKIQEKLDGGKVLFELETIR